MLTPDFLRAKFGEALPYCPYLATGSAGEASNWNAFHGRVRLTEPQRTLLGSFKRRINALCLSGTWCGDCVQQCPFLDHIAAAAPGSIELRFLDRDEHPDLAGHLKICGGGRVPVLLLLNEDYDFVALAGDRTLARYRALASRTLGPACPLPGAPVPADEMAATLQDWVDEFERVQLILRLSSKLRQRHGD
jgi:thiol-disulfide isomerase/thioredoxin